MLFWLSQSGTHGPSGSGLAKLRNLGPHDDQEKFSYLGPARTRTKKDLGVPGWDRTGQGSRKL